VRYALGERQGLSTYQTLPPKCCGEIIRSPYKTADEYYACVLKNEGRVIEEEGICLEVVNYLY
jgi:hypothetical protein